MAVLTKLRRVEGDFLVLPLYLFHYSCHSRYCHLMEKIRTFKNIAQNNKPAKHFYAVQICTIARVIIISHLSNIEGVMVEAFDKERNSSWWELVVVSQ